MAFGTLVVNQQTDENTTFIFKSTALVRGYIGSRKIKNKKLFLVSLVGFIKSNEKVDLEYLFPKKIRSFCRLVLWQD